MLSSNFIWLGLLIGVAGSCTYLWNILRGRVKVNRVCWLVLAVAPLIAFAAELRDGVGVEAAMTFWVGFAPLMYFAASFTQPNAHWRATRLDVACGVISLAALVLWLRTGSTSGAIGLAIGADFLAILPIVVKAWRFPHTEVMWGFLAGGVNAAIALLVLDEWAIANFAFPTYIAILSLCMVLTITLRQKTVIIDMRDAVQAAAPVPPGPPAELDRVLTIK